MIPGSLTLHTPSRPFTCQRCGRTCSSEARPLPKRCGPCAIEVNRERANKPRRKKSK
jgi:hypothetical protein